jgi:hypothetical protein
MYNNIYHIRYVWLNSVRDHTWGLAECFKISRSFGVDLPNTMDR